MRFIPYEILHISYAILHFLEEHAKTCSRDLAFLAKICFNFLQGLSRKVLYFLKTSLARIFDRMDPELTLDKAVTLARQSEAMKTQPSVVRLPAIDDFITKET